MKEYLKVHLYCGFVAVSKQNTVINRLRWLDTGGAQLCLSAHAYLGHNVPEEFLHLMFFGVVGDLVGEASRSPSSLWF